jgi:hypothetical protein
LQSLRGGIDVRCSHFRKRPSECVGGYKSTIKIQAVSAGVSARGKDLQSGNLNPAQSDLEMLEHNSPFLRAGTAVSTSSATAACVGAGNNPIAQAFNQLERDLKAGNVAAAQQDFSTIQQTFQNAQRAYSTLQQSFQQSANSSRSGIRSVSTTA